MANEIVPNRMADPLKEIDRRRALIAYRCTRDDIREINEPLTKDISDLRAAIDALDAATLRAVDSDQKIIRGKRKQ
jgi:hypothetical protein